MFGINVLLERLLCCELPRTLRAGELLYLVKVRPHMLLKGSFRFEQPPTVLMITLEAFFGWLILRDMLDAEKILHRFKIYPNLLCRVEIRPAFDCEALVDLLRTE